MTPERLDISTESRDAAAGEIAFVRVAGEVDMANAHVLREQLGSPASREAAGVVLDLTGVPFMDSDGLRAVLVAAAGLDARLAVIAPADSAVGRLLELADVSDRVPSFETEKDAVAAVSGY